MKKSAIAEPASKPKGHWPKGRRRNEDVDGKWSRTRLAAANLINEHWERGRISNQALAAVLAVDPKTIARWLDGTDRPPAEMQTALAEWVKQKRPKRK